MICGRVRFRKRPRNVPSDPSPCLCHLVLRALTAFAHLTDALSPNVLHMRMRHRCLLPLRAVSHGEHSKAGDMEKGAAGCGASRGRINGLRSSGEGRLARLRSWASARRPSLPALCGHGSGIGYPWWGPEGRHARRRASCSGVRVRLRMPSVSSLENRVPHDPRAEILASWSQFCYHPRTQASGFRFRRRQDKRA